MTAIQREESKLWKAKVNIKGEQFEMYSRSKTKRGARTHIVSRVAKLLGISAVSAGLKLVDGINLTIKEVERDV